MKTLPIFDIMDEVKYYLPADSLVVIPPEWYAKREVTEGELTAIDLVFQDERPDDVKAEFWDESEGRSEEVKPSPLYLAPFQSVIYYYIEELEGFFPCKRL